MEDFTETREDSLNCDAEGCYSLCSCRVRRCHGDREMIQRTEERMQESGVSHGGARQAANGLGLRTPISHHRIGERDHAVHLVKLGTRREETRRRGKEASEVLGCGVQRPVALNESAGPTAASWRSLGFSVSRCPSIKCVSLPGSAGKHSLWSSAQNTSRAQNGRAIAAPVMQPIPSPGSEEEEFGWGRGTETRFDDQQCQGLTCAAFCGRPAGMSEIARPGASMLVGSGNLGLDFLYFVCLSLR